MVKELELNESFKAFVRETFSDKSEAATLLFLEVVNDRATITRLNIDELKSRAVDEIKSEFVTKDFVRAEIATTKEELRTEIIEAKDELRAEIAQVKDDLAKTKIDLLKCVFGLQLTTTGLIIAVIKFL